MRARAWLVPFLALTATWAAAGPQEDELLKAVRRGDTAAVKALLDAGVPADAKYRYDRTALSFAADRGHRKIVELLLARGADVNAKDTYYGATPLFSAVMAGHAEVVGVLLAKGAEPAGVAVSTGLEKDDIALVKVAAASGKVPAEHLSAALVVSEKADKKEMAAALRALGAVPLPALTYKPDPVVLARYVGAYAAERGPSAALVVENGVLQMPRSGGRPALVLEPLDATSFRVVDIDGVSRVTFEVDGEVVKSLTFLTPGEPEMKLARVEEKK